MIFYSDTPHDIRTRPSLNGLQVASVVVGVAGVAMLVISLFGDLSANAELVLFTSIAAMSMGTLGFVWATYRNQPAGIKNNGVWFESLTNRGMWGWILGLILTGFYVVLYFYPGILGFSGDGESNTGLIGLFDPLSYFFKNEPASQWFVYGVLYSLAILLFGVKFIVKYRHNKYQVLRTYSVMFFQLGFAFLIPEFLMRMQLPYNDFKNMWPLNYYFFDEWNVETMTSSGAIGLFMLGFGVLMIFIGSPILTYFYGKRWYCSWVCGCGGLAETAGDPFRHLSDKSLKAWQVERWLVHGVLLFAVVMTAGVIYSYLHQDPSGYYFTTNWLVVLLALVLAGLLGLMWMRPKYISSMAMRDKTIIASAIGLVLIFLLWGHFYRGSELFFVDAAKLRSWYGFAIGAIFSGVIGVGFYPIMGSRVWCRFGCPMAAILGIQQKFFSRFRITTNGGQCISCGNCSTYCEMGIDVRAYAQKGQNIVRASCVGCGICAAVCPRGVLRLENGKIDIDNKVTDGFI